MQRDLQQASEGFIARWPGTTLVWAGSVRWTHPSCFRRQQVVPWACSISFHFVHLDRRGSLAPGSTHDHEIRSYDGPRVQADADHQLCSSLHPLPTGGSSRLVDSGQRGVRCASPLSRWCFSRQRIPNARRWQLHLPRADERPPTPSEPFTRARLATALSPNHDDQNPQDST